MKILKLLNSKYLFFILSFFMILISKSLSNEPADIWNLDPNKKTNNSTSEESLKEDNKSKISIYEMQSKNINELDIEQDETLLSKEIELAGLYDPEDNDLRIDMWSNSDGKKILELVKKIDKIELSNDAKEILNISLLTNSYYPKNNISNKKFTNLKIDWLIKNNNLKLIEEYLDKNKNVDENSKLIRFLIDEYLSDSKIEKACSTLFKINSAINDEYLSKFHIYCLISINKKEEAQLQFDLKKETGFKDDFFENKFNYLMEYEIKSDLKTSENSILEFHLSHRTDPDFSFEPNEFTSKAVWRYLSSSNLLDNLENINLTDENKINIIEKATHDGIYEEKELFNLYKRFQFSIDQLLNIKQSYKLLSNIESRALLYQGVLINSEVNIKLELIKILKDSFIADQIESAFKNELANILKKIDLEKIPSNFTNFYERYVNEEKINLTKIKINNKIIHQSRLLNYFKPESKIKNISKETNDLLSKIKRDKKYFISTKDIILIEALKSDGVKISKKYDNIYQVDNSNMPSDIQLFIDKQEIGLVLLRIVEVIGQDQLKDIGPETLYFVISALNQLNIDILRNQILLKILPLKV